MLSNFYKHKIILRKVQINVLNRPEEKHISADTNWRRIGEMVKITLVTKIRTISKKQVSLGNSRHACACASKSNPLN